MQSSIIWLDRPPTGLPTTTVPFTTVAEFARGLTQSNMAAEADVLAATLDDWFASQVALVVTGVEIQTTQDLEVLVRFLVDPAYIRGSDLYLVGTEPIVHAFGESGDLATVLLTERLQYVAQRAGVRAVLDGLPPMTPIEQMLLDELRTAGLSPRVQYDIPPFRVDFAFEDVNLAVEADGREWHDPDKDWSRDEKLEELGWHVMHFSGADIWADAKSCAEQIAVRRATLADSASSPKREKQARSQSVIARSSLNFSAGVIQPSVSRGRSFSSAAI